MKETCLHPHTVVGYDGREWRKTCHDCGIIIELLREIKDDIIDIKDTLNGENNARDERRW